MPTNQQYSGRVCNIRRVKRLNTHITQMIQLIGEMAVDYKDARPEYLEAFLALGSSLDLMSEILLKLRSEL